MTFRNAQVRESPVHDTFDDVSHAVKEFMAVLLHEAHESMSEPLSNVPEQPYLHPVDVDTEEPGIVDSREEMRVLRCPLPLPRVVYRARPGGGAIPKKIIQHETPPPIVNRDNEEAQAEANADMEKRIVKAQRQAANVERRMERQAETKRQRDAESPEEREARLAEQRRKREESKQRKVAKEAEGQSERKKKKPNEPSAVTEDAVLTTDVSAFTIMAPSPKRRRKKGDKTQFFPHPLPHHRHLDALQSCIPHDSLLPALLRGEPCENVIVIQGPPGTGKTRALVSHVPKTSKRVLLCAPTNVGATNLYTRCLDMGFGDECALSIPFERVPPGTTVLSNDPSRRLVCATVSARGGAMLDGEAFDQIFLDEAAQCMEAWVWTLLRPEVEGIVMAGDVKQLPAMTSESGRALRHDRSLMERLVVNLHYPATELIVQHRMAPQLLSFPNATFYENRLTTGSGAPSHGTVEWIHVEEGKEEVIGGTSMGNRAEAHRVGDLARDLEENAILLAPYTAQCRLLLAESTGREVHTIDSFQGREADTVILSMVRDGSVGSVGFWSDPRRLTVALTRARKRLVIVASGIWPADSLLHKMRQALM